MARKDISGKRYGRLVAIEPVGKNKKGLTLWRCKCDCGNEKIATVTILNAGKTSSCGCYQHERQVKLMLQNMGKEIQDNIQYGFI